MSKVFCIVEKKEKDLYTIYDVDNKGVCCCSLYTIKEIVQQGCEVKGYYINNGKVIIKEVGLDGKPREKKAPVICSDTTKRSASTILKGLDEKHYPREKQNRKGILGLFDEGAIVLVTYKVGQGISENKVGVVVPIMKNRLNETKVVYDFDGFFILTESILKIEKKKPTEFEKEYGAKIYRTHKEKLEIELEKEELEAKIKRLVERYSKLDLLCSRYRYEYILNGYRESTDGTEEFKQSTIKGSCNKHFIQAVIEKTNRPLLYTYGYTWKNPTTLRKPITKEQAISIVTKASLLDITATKDEIHLNEFSGNDMW